MPTKKTEETEVVTLNIYQRMQAITQEISAVAKNLNVGFGKSQYKAVGEADVLAAVKPIEAKYGVYSYPLERSIVDTAILENVKADGTISKSQFLRVETTYRFVNMDKPEEFIDMVSYGDGVDTQDKAPGKAMTYSDKYSLLKAYKIITGDDPDQNASGEYTSYNASAKAKSANNASNIPNNVEGEGYPTREKMIEVCNGHFSGENLNKLLGFYKAESIDKLTNEQLMVAYNTAIKGKK